MENGNKNGNDNTKHLLSSEFITSSTRMGPGVNGDKIQFDFDNLRRKQADINDDEEDQDHDEDDDDDDDNDYDDYTPELIKQQQTLRVDRDRKVSYGNEGDLDLNLIESEIIKQQNSQEDEEEIIVPHDYLDDDLMDEMIEMDLFTNIQPAMMTHQMNLQATYNNNQEEDQTCSDTIKINEDDLISRRDVLTELYKKSFFDKNECYCDLTQNIFVVKKTRLSKSILRKVLTLEQLLTVQQQLTPFAENPTNTNDLLKMNLQDQDPKVLIKSSVQNQEYKKKLFRLLRSICERVLIDNLTVCDQFHGQILEYQQQQLLKAASQQNGGGSGTSSPPPSLLAGQMANHPVNKLWTEVRNRGCQFLGPQMQEDVLKLILHALEIFTRLSRKVLVLYVVHMLKKHYSRASKTSVGHVIQLLYRAGCFKVEKRENDASLMELKKEYSKYGPLRRQHDAQIIQIALESGIRMSPEQWSQKLYGDSTHKSEMQSIIDKLQSQLTLDKLIGDFYSKLNSLSGQSMFMNNYSIVFNELKADFDHIASINFEKKVVQSQANISQSDLGLLTSSSLGNKRNSIASNSDSIKSALNSGGDSMASEDEFNYLASSNFDYLDDAMQPQQPQLPQAKIIWSLLLDCLRRTINILNVHVDFLAQAPTATIFDLNNNNININGLNLNKLTTTTVLKTNPNVNMNAKGQQFAYKSSLFYNESFSPNSSSPSSPSPVISSSSSGYLVSNTERLVRMGPNVAIQPPSNKGFHNSNNVRNNNQQQPRYNMNKNNNQHQQQQQQYFNRNQPLYNGGNNNKMIDDFNGVGFNNPLHGHQYANGTNNKFNTNSASNANAKSYDFNSLNYNNFGNIGAGNDMGKNNGLARNWNDGNSKYQQNNNQFNQMNNNFNPLRMIQLQEQYEQFNSKPQYNPKNQQQFVGNDQTWSPFSNSSQFIDKKDFATNRRFNQLKDN